MKINSTSPIIKDTIENASKAIKGSVESIQDLSETQKDQVKKAIDETIVNAAEVPNTFVYWLAVGAVAFVAATIVLGGLILAGFDKGIPNFLQTTLATAIGALAGMVVPTPKAGL